MRQCRTLMPMKIKLPKPTKLTNKLGRRRVKTVEVEPGSRTPVLSSSASRKTVKQHRKEIIDGARKYIYPLAPTKRRIVLITLWLLGAAVVAFLVVATLLLYKFQSTSTFTYRVSQIIPFPVAKAGNQFVSYEDYLFNVRRYAHYYEYRRGGSIDLSTGADKQQIDQYKKQALVDVVNDAYVRQIAKKYGISVGSTQISDTLAIAQDRLGDNRGEFASILNTFWGWSVSDYKRELNQELLAQNVVTSLDESAHSRVNLVESKLAAGQSFDELAATYSDDKLTADSGGVLRELVTRNDTDLPPAIVSAAFNLKEGEVSQPIVSYQDDSGYSLQIIKNLGNEKGGSLKVAHIQINLAPLRTYLQPLKTKNPPTYYIKVN